MMMSKTFACRGSCDPQIFRALLALIRDHVIGDLGSLAQVAQAGLLDRRDMDEHVLATTAIGLDETVALGRVKPLHRAAWHAARPENEGPD
jgi:hypothetical protein